MSLSAGKFGLHPSPLSVFVYGTLMPGEIGYQQFCAGRVSQSQPAIAPGHLYHLPAGYPAMTPGTGWVQGWVLQFSDSKILSVLDQYEDYDPNRAPSDNLYDRQQVAVLTPTQQPLGLAWIYLMRTESVRALAGQYLPSGRWRAASRNE